MKEKLFCVDFFVCGYVSVDTSLFLSFELKQELQFDYMSYKYQAKDLNLFNIWNTLMLATLTFTDSLQTSKRTKCTFYFINGEIKY